MTLHTLQISAKRDLGGGNTVVNTYHFHPDSSMAWAGTNRVTHANILIGHLKTFYNALGVAGLAGGYDIGTVVLEYETGQPPIYVGATAQSSTGAAGGTVPYQCAAVATWRTVKAGKSYRGRTYFGPIISTAQNGQAWNSTNVGQWNTALGTFLSNVASSSFDLCVASKATDSSESVITGAFTGAMRTMRSRAN
jgi:hypothetical protein